MHYHKTSPKQLLIMIYNVYDGDFKGYMTVDELYNLSTLPCWNKKDYEIAEYDIFDPFRQEFVQVGKNKKKIGITKKSYIYIISKSENLISQFDKLLLECYTKSV